MAVTVDADIVGRGIPSGSTVDSPVFTGQQFSADGSKTLPSQSFTSDPNTGRYWRSADVITDAAGGIEVLQASATGTAVIAALGMSSGDLSTTGSDCLMTRVAANNVRFGASTATTTSRTEANKQVTAISNNVATAVFTVTVPNAQHNATIEVELTGILGAGGAIGAGEASSTNSYKINVSRTAGVNAVASAVSTAFGAAASNVAGAATVTTTGTVSSISGAVGATNTFTINVTIVRSGGSSDNHVCLAYAKLMNANATGITIA